MMVGILPGNTAPDVWSIVCHFNRLNKNDIQWRGRRFSEKERETWNHTIYHNKAHNYFLETEQKFIIQIALNSLAPFRKMFTFCVKSEYIGLIP